MWLQVLKALTLGQGSWLFFRELFASACVFLFHRDTGAGVEMAFLGTRAGLMRSALYVGSEKISNK